MDATNLLSKSGPTLRSEFDFKRLVRVLHPYRWFLLFVVLPTMVSAMYLYAFASDQYESSSDYIVRRAQSSTRGQLGMGQIFGIPIGADQSRSDAYFVEEYLLSHDAVESLRRNDSLVERYRRPGTDALSALWYANPSPETLLDYFRRHVTVTQEDSSGISHLRVTAFTPDDAFEINRKLLAMGEARINEINARTFKDQVSNALKDMRDAETALAALQGQLTSFRQEQRDLDPASSGRAQIGMVTGATSELLLARAKLQSMQRFLSPTSPQYISLKSQVSALEAQIAGQASEIAGAGPSTAGKLGGYEGLVIRKEIASQRFAAASASYEGAKAEALKQQLYLTRIVEPNMPVKSLYPKRGQTVVTIFFALIIAYAIGWLLIAGVKEHTV